MPVGEMPILEILLRQLRHHGVREVTMLTGHLAYLIEAYFGDGSKLGVTIDYLRESEPMGTAGPLSQLAGRLEDDFFVMNGDLLTDIDFGGLMRHHKEQGCGITVGAFARKETIELGVLRLGEDGRVTGYDEKPTMLYDVSMGIYAMSPATLSRIPDGYYDMPTLVLDVLAAGEPVACWRHQGRWLDIGRPDDYQDANDLLRESQDAFLPRAAAAGA
jgi:NDP-sugar pyrophosphorylase family protein